jgi:hypothetical protein|tara:strand:- start:249 stop:599 length:351 start_codon:yes stop_codon:yes gene_type:complete
MAETPFRGQAYGQAKQQEEALATVPMADLVSSSPQVAPGAQGDFTRPTNRPGEPLNESATIPPAEVMTEGPLGNPNAMRLLSRLLVLDDIPSTSASTRNIIREIAALASLTDIQRG